MNQLPDKKRDPLKKLIGQDMLEQPSINFTSDVMSKLGMAPASAGIRYEPVIPAKGWIFIGLIAALLIYLALSMPTSESIISNSGMVQVTLHQTTSIFEKLFTGSFMVMLTIAAAAVLILFSADSWYRQSRLQGT